MMWFITIAFKRRGNKQLSNWVTNLGLGHHETCMGLATIFAWGMWERWFMEWAKPFGYQGLNKLGHLNTTCDNWPKWQQKCCHKFFTLIIKKYPIFIRVLYHGALKTRDQKVLGFLNLKPHMRNFKILREVGEKFLLSSNVVGRWRLKMWTCVCHPTKVTIGWF